jgi:hypothetical protein
MPTMNTKRLLELAEFIEPLKPVDDVQLVSGFSDLDGEHFNMAAWWRVRECGTCGCIAGWAVKLFGDPNERVIDHAPVAAKLLGLDQITAEELFYAKFRPQGMPLDRVTPAMAAAELRRLACS